MSASDIEQQILEKMEVDGGTDVLFVNSALSTITEVTSILLGIIAWVLLIVIPIVVALELVYLTAPIFRNGTNKVIYSGQGQLQKVIKFTLRDALKAYEDANTAETGNSALWLYLKRKIVWVLLTFIMLYLLLGGAGTFMSLAIKLFKGVIEMLSNL